jgi:hypothetical protein
VAFFVPAITKGQFNCKSSPNGQYTIKKCMEEYEGERDQSKLVQANLRTSTYP